MSLASIFQEIETSLNDELKKTHSIVVATCGIAGSGKSTLAKAITARYPSFTRLSIDELIAEKHGLFGFDYDRDDKLYEEYMDEADEKLQGQYDELLKSHKHIVLDRSFWAKKDREAHQTKAEAFHATWILIYLEAEKDFLWQRIVARSQEERTANSAYDITRERFEKYWDGFQVPNGEGEIVVQADERKEHNATDYEKNSSSIWGGNANIGTSSPQSIFQNPS